MIDVTKSLADELISCFGERIKVNEPDTGMVSIQVPVDQWVDVAQTLRDEPQFAFSQLSDLCGVDYLSYGQTEWETTDASHEGFSRGVEGLGPGRFDWQSRPEAADIEQRFAVVVHLISVTQNMRLRMTTFAADEGLPVVPTLVETWSSANWYERETFDMFGIIFEGHPDLRRLLSDYGFTGHPFRKDFPLIGNVTVRYDEEKARVVYEPVEIEPRVLVPRVIRADSRYKADDIDKAADDAAETLAREAE